MRQALMGLLKGPDPLCEISVFRLRCLQLLDFLGLELNQGIDVRGLLKCNLDQKVSIPVPASP